MSDSPLVTQYVRALLATIAGVIVVLGFEGRVIFHSFANYIPLDFPYNWIIVSTFLFLKAGVIGAHFAGNTCPSEPYLLYSVHVLVF